MAVADLAAGGCKTAVLDDVELLIVRSPVGIHAVENMCSHAYAKLDEGRVRGVHVFCPLHGLRFDLRDGKPSGKLTDKPIKAFHCEVQGDEVMVDLARRLDDG